MKTAQAINWLLPRGTVVRIILFVSIIQFAFIVYLAGKIPDAPTHTNINVNFGGLEAFRSVDTNLSEQIFKMVLPAYQGRRYEYGVWDCSRFTQQVMNDLFNLEIPRTAEMQCNSGKKISPGKEEQGDLVCMYYGAGGKTVDHVGLYIGNEYMVENSASRGVRLTSLKERWIRDNIKWFTRIGESS